MPVLSSVVVLPSKLALESVPSPDSSNLSRWFVHCDTVDTVSLILRLAFCFLHPYQSFESHFTEKHRLAYHLAIACWQGLILLPKSRAHDKEAQCRRPLIAASFGFWSRRPGSNRRHLAWEASVLPLNYFGISPVFPGCQHKKKKRKGKSPNARLEVERHTGLEPALSAWKADVLTIEHQCRMVGRLPAPVVIWNPFWVRKQIIRPTHQGCDPGQRWRPGHHHHQR